jgi:hypothetical protein
MSLAAFIGGRATGPRLNKPRPQENVHDPTLYDTKPYSYTVSPLAQVARGEGGPARAESTNRGNTAPGLEAGGRLKLSNVSTYDPPRPVQPSSATVNSSVAATGPTPAFPVTSRNRLAAGDSKGDPTPIEGPRESASLPFSTLPKSSAQSPAGGTSDSAKSMPTGNSVLRSPFLKGSNVSSVFDHEQPSKPLTPSLTRLQGRGFVGERVKASESPLKEAVLYPLPTSPPSSSSVANPPQKSTQELTRKRTVLDRWHPESPSTPFKDNFPEDPPQSLKSFVSTPESPPSSTARYMDDRSTLSSEKSTSSPVSSPPSGKLPTQSITFPKPGIQKSIFPLAIETTQNSMPLSFNKGQSSTLSSMQVPKGTGEVVQGTIHTQKYDESSHDSQTIGPKTNDSIGLVSTSSTPLNHVGPFPPPVPGSERYFMLMLDFSLPRIALGNPEKGLPHFQQPPTLVYLLR